MELEELMVRAFEKGDIVQLKSGGPKMTVTAIDSYGKHYYCQWFAGSKLEDGKFPPEALQAPAITEKPEQKSK